MAVRLGYVVCVVVVACMAMPSVVLADVQDCLPEGESPLVTIGEPAFLCLRFNNNTQALMTPIVDEFTQLSIEDCECAGLGGVVLRRLTLGATANTIMPENTGYYDLSDRVLVSSRDDNTHDYVITVHPVVNDKVASFWKTYKKWAAGVNDVKTVSVITAIVLVDVRRRVLCCAPSNLHSRVACVSTRHCSKAKSSTLRTTTGVSSVTPRTKPSASSILSLRIRHPSFRTRTTRGVRLTVRSVPARTAI